MVGLMDCNNFFVSCERLFRPDLMRKPVAVLSSNDGCIVARSQEVKDLGIPMGAPYFQIKDLCTQHNIAIFSSNFSLYRDVSQRVMHTLRAFVGDIEIYSIDEAFFLAPDPYVEEDIAHIRSEILRTTGMPVSFGVGDTKTIAKIASTYAKKGTGVHVFTNDLLKEHAARISCGSIWGIGRQTAQKLAKCGIYTVEDFLRRDLGYYRQHFGVHGERLYFELTGKPASTHHYDAEEEFRQSYTSTRSFPRSITDRTLIESAIAYHVTNIGEELRHDRVCTQTLTVICAPCRYGNFSLHARSLSVELTFPTNDTSVLLHEALLLLEKIYENGIPYKKAGAVCSDVVPEEFISENLFAGHSQKSESVYAIVDQVNVRMGKGTLHTATIQQTDKWQGSTLWKSNGYTTKWDEIARVKAL